MAGQVSPALTRGRMTFLRGFLILKMNSKPFIGKNKPKYSFILNPYADYRASKCPACQKLTHPRKFPLLIFVKDTDPVALGLTCRYCSKCELIIAHKKQLEEELCIVFSSFDPESIGNEYLVAGTIDRKLWKNNLGKSLKVQDLLEYATVFKKRLDLDPGGWRPD